MPSPMHQSHARPLFEVDGEAFHWPDVEAHARHTGRWDEYALAAADGLACQAEYAAHPEPDTEAAIDAAGDEFRYDRDLLTAAEMEAWLAARGVTTRDWLEAVERATLRARWADRLDQLREQHAPDAAAIAAALLGDLRCSDGYATLAAELAADAAAAAAQAVPLARAPDEDAAARAARLAAAAADFRATHAPAEAISREIGARRLEWLRIEGVRAIFADEAEAREAALCVREDGLELAEVAASAGVAADDIVAYLDDIDGVLHDRFMATGPGGIVGPIVEDDGVVLFHLTAKVVPTADDPDLVARAAELLAGRAVAAEVDRRVRWLAEAAPRP